MAGLEQARTHEIVERMLHFMQVQYEANSGVTLNQIRDDNCPPYYLNPQLLVFAAAEREAMVAVLAAESEAAHSGSQPPHESLLGAFAHSTQEYIYRNNQFITLSADDRREMTAVYIEFVDSMIEALSGAHTATEVEEQMRRAQEDHLLRLQGFVTRLAENHGEQGASLIDRQVVCEQYSAQTQLRLFGIDKAVFHDLMEPVLDVGCGRSGTLVSYLREHGIDAFGIDRSVMPSRYLLRADWVEFRYGVSCWGTIISHMAFSNHFIFHHLYRHGTPEIYAGKYVEMLGSLKPGGDMYYTPGLPFIERVLPASRYKVSRRSISVPSRGTAGSGLPGPPEEDTLYSARITRLNSGQPS